MKTRASLITLLILVTLLAGLMAGTASAQLSKDARQNMLRASVKLMTPFDADPNGGSLCSGTMLTTDGYILSNFHCIGYAEGERDQTLDSLGLKPGDLYNKKGLSVVAITDNPRQLPVPTYIAQVVKADATIDLSVLKIVAYYNSKQKLPAKLPVVTMPVADSEQVETLDEVFVIGYPGIAGDTVTATDGKISGFIDENNDGVTDWLKTDVLVNQGDSGGSAVNDKGELIGIPTARLQDESGNVIYLIRPVNFAAPYIAAAQKAGGSSGDVGATPTTPVTPPALTMTSQNFGALVFGTGFNEKTGVTGEGVDFPSGTNEIHAGVPYQNMRDGMAWGYIWQLDGQDATGKDKLKWSFGKSGVLDLYLKGKTGLSDGSYNLQVFLNGKLAQEGQFTVGQTAEPLAPEKPAVDAGSGVVLTGQILDASTKRPIKGAVIVFLKPGATVDDFDADKSQDKADTVYSYGVTAADGTFTLDTPLARGEVYSAVVGAKGYQRIAEDDAIEITQDDPDYIELDPIELDRQ